MPVIIPSESNIRSKPTNKLLVANRCLFILWKNCAIISFGAILSCALILITTSQIFAAPVDSSDGTANKPQCAQLVSHFLAHLNGVPISINDIIQEMPPQVEGNSLLEVSQFLESIGLKTEGQRLQWDELSQEKTPFLAHLEGEDHFVVVEDINGDRIAIFDGDAQRYEIEVDKIKSRFSGVILRVWPPSDFIPQRPGVIPGNPDGPRIVFETLFKDLGEVVHEEGMIRFSFNFSNRGTHPLQIRKVQGDCSCTDAKSVDQDVLPGESSSIVVEFHPERLRGPFTKIVAVATNDPVFPVVPLNFNGYISKRLSVTPSSVYLDSLSSNESTTQRVFVRYISERDFKVKQIMSDIPGVQVRVDPYSDESLSAVVPAFQPSDKRSFDLRKIVYSFHKTASAASR